eukprot:3880267-Amphidinium_carterae.1
MCIRDSSSASACDAIANALATAAAVRTGSFGGNNSLPSSPIAELHIRQRLPKPNNGTRTSTALTSALRQSVSK